jgi:hypothetical protein
MPGGFCAGDSDFIRLLEQARGKRSIELLLPERPATIPSPPLCISNYCLIGEPGRSMRGLIDLCLRQFKAGAFAVEDKSP